MELTQPGSTERWSDRVLSDRERQLARYDLDDPTTRSMFDTIVDLAVRSTRAPIAWMACGDRDRQQVLASTGLQRTEIPAGEGTIARTIETHGPIAIADIRTFASCTAAPLAAMGCSVAGVPLRAPNGLSLGTLVVMDVVPRQFETAHLHLLNALGQQAIAHLELSHSLRQATEASSAADRPRTSANHRLQALLDSAQLRQTQQSDRLFQLSPDIIVEMGTDCQIRRVNPAWQDITGFAPQTLKAQPFLDFVHPDDVEATRVCLDSLHQGNRITDFEHRLIGRDGTPIWLSWHAIPYQAEQLTYAIARDITTRKQAELSLQQQSQRDRLMGSLSQHMQETAAIETILAASAEDIRQALSAQRVAIIGLRSDRAGATVAESVAPPATALSGHILNQPEWFDTLAWCEAHGMWHVDNASAATEPETAGIAAYWARHCARAAFAAPIYRDGHLWGLLLVQRCHQLDAWSSFELDLLHHVVEHLAVAVRQADAHKHMQLINADLKIQAEIRTAEVQLAFEFEALLKRITDKVRDSLDESQILQTAVEEVARGLEATCCNAALYDLEHRVSTIHYEFAQSVPLLGRQNYFMENAPDIYEQLLQGQHFQYCALYPNPRRGRVAMLACPIVDDRGVLGDLWAINRPGRGFTTLEVRLVQQVANQCAIAIRQARLYSAAQAQVQELEKLNRLKDDFLSTISHELRTPVSNMKMAVSLLKVKLAHLLTAQELPLLDRYLNILTTECQREIQLIDDLLDLNHLETNDPPSVGRRLVFDKWLYEAIEPFIERSRSRQQAVVTEIQPDFPTVDTDPVILGRVVAELMQNAYKYTPAGGEIRVSARTDDRYCTLEFTNTGVTIVPAELERIFDKFYRIPRSDPWQQGGTGLGLALVRKLVTHLGGTIQVVSGDGAVTFTIALPLHPPLSSPRRAPLRVVDSTNGLPPSIS